MPSPNLPFAEPLLHALFWSAVTIAFYLLAKRLYRRWPRMWLMPLAVAPVLVGAVVLALHASYRVQRQLKITVGVDNLLDKTYAEHLNLAGNAGFGFPANTRLNEPGRTLWLRADMQF